MADLRMLPVSEVLDPLSEVVDVELLESVKANGVMLPLIVYPKHNSFMIADGKKRFACLKALGIEKVPVQVVDEDRVKAAQLIASVPYLKTEPAQYLKAVKSVLKTCSLAELCKRIDRTDVELARFCEIPVAELRAYDASDSKN